VIRSNVPDFSSHVFASDCILGPTNGGGGGGGCYPIKFYIRGFLLRYCIYLCYS